MDYDCGAHFLAPRSFLACCLGVPIEMFRVLSSCVFSLIFNLSFSGTIRLPIVSRDLSPEQLISSSNWEWGSVPEKKVTRFIVRDPNDIQGKASRYIKKSGDIFYVGDFHEPDIIHNQDKVTLTILTGKIHVSVTGIALKNGALGCTIRVLNPATQKILDASVVDSRNVEVRLN